MSKKKLRYVGWSLNRWSILQGALVTMEFTRYSVTDLRKPGNLRSIVTFARLKHVAFSKVRSWSMVRAIESVGDNSGQRLRFSFGDESYVEIEAERLSLIEW